MVLSGELPRPGQYVDWFFWWPIPALVCWCWMGRIPTLLVKWIFRPHINSGKLFSSLSLNSQSRTTMRSPLVRNRRFAASLGGCLVIRVTVSSRIHSCGPRLKGRLLSIRESGPGDYRATRNPQWNNGWQRWPQGPHIPIECNLTQ